MQVNKEDLYFLYIYINVYAEDIKELEYCLNKIEGIMQAKGLITKRANFREEQIFKACLPFMENNIDIKKSARRNILTSGLLSTYPFISASIFDENGIFIGRNIYNNSLIFLIYCYLSVCVFRNKVIEIISLSRIRRFVFPFPFPTC